MKTIATLIAVLFATFASAQPRIFSSVLNSTMAPISIQEGTAGGGGGMGLIAGEDLALRVDYLGQFGNLDVLRTDARSLERLNGAVDPRIVLIMRNRAIRGNIVESANPNSVSISTDDGKQIVVLDSMSNDEIDSDMNEFSPVE